MAAGVGISPFITGLRPDLHRHEVTYIRTFLLFGYLLVSFIYRHLLSIFQIFFNF